MIRINDRLEQIIDKEGRFGEAYWEVLVRLIERPKGSDDNLASVSVMKSDLFKKDKEIAELKQEIDDLKSRMEGSWDDAFRVWLKGLGQTHIRADKVLKKLEGKE